jgi:tetratricopeptide (TPR) repeat protein
VSAAAAAAFAPLRGAGDAAPPLPAPGGFPGITPGAVPSVSAVGDAFGMVDAERVVGALVDASAAALGSCMGSPAKAPMGYLPSSASLPRLGQGGADDLAVPDAELLAEELRKEGVRLVRGGQAAAAALVYTEALRHAPHAPLLLLNRSACYTRLGSHAEALADALLAARLQPGLGRAHWQAALALEAQGRSAEALEEHERCVAAARASREPQLAQYVERLETLRKTLAGAAQREARVMRVIEEEEKKREAVAAKALRR